jgi:predicted secreted protein
VNGDTTKEFLDFRDFNTGNQYKVRLIQKSTGKEQTVKSAFHIELSLLVKDGRTKTYTIGLPNHYRENVLEYRIRQIISSPDEQHLVFVVERDHYSPKGKSVRYMVETVKIF